jgi:hypothetical protein
MKVCRKKPKQRAFFLFNDILVYGRVVISGRKVKQRKKENLFDKKFIQFYDLVFTTKDNST